MSNSPASPLANYRLKRVGLLSAVAIGCLAGAGFNLYRSTFWVKDLDEYVWTLVFMTLQASGALLILTALLPVLIRFIFRQPAAWVEDGYLRWSPGWGKGVALKDIESYSFQTLGKSRVTGLYIFSHGGKRTYHSFEIIQPQQGLVDLLRRYGSNRVDLTVPG